MIRQLGPDDSRAYFQIRLDGLKLNPEAFGTGAEDWAKATDDQVRSLLTKSSQDDFVLGEFLDDVLVGVVGLKREKKHSVGHKGTIWGLMVLPEFRNRGVGTSLLQKLIAMAEQHPELHYVRAVVTLSELNARRIFESCGFTTYGVEKHGIKEGSRFLDQAFMALGLREANLEEDFTFMEPGEIRDGELWLELEKKAAADPGKGYVPSYIFRVRLDGVSEPIGHIDLRVGNVPSLVRYGGHIGYGIDET